MVTHRFDPHTYRLSARIQRSQRDLVFRDATIKALVLPGVSPKSKPKVTRVRIADAGAELPEFDHAWWSINDVEPFDPDGELPGSILHLKFHGKAFSERAAQDKCEQTRLLSHAFINRRTLQATVRFQDDSEAVMFLKLDCRVD